MIRKAIPSDFRAVAPLIVQAMEDLAMKFTRTEDLNLAVPVFEHFFQLEGNQYSYENTLVYEENGTISGSITGYDGNDLQKLRSPFLEYLLEKYGFPEIPEDETEMGEFYLDTVSVSPGQQGKGIGRKLIEAMIGHAREKGFKKVGLLVDAKNPSARKLYERIGFRWNKDKTLMNGRYGHLIFEIKD